LETEPNIPDFDPAATTDNTDGSSGASGNVPPANPPVTTPAIQEQQVLGKPKYQINDDSKIDITVCQHEFEVSMARSDFSSSSTESSMYVCLNH
jgi:hypothetical protein